MSQLVLLNFADKSYRSAQRLNTKTGLGVGGFDLAISVGPKDIDAGFRKAQSGVLSRRRGAGYWLWKPYFILRTLDTMRDGDWLFYSDAGAYFIRSFRVLVDAVADPGQHVYLFDLEHAETTYTKRDVFVALNADAPEYRGRQRLATFQLYRASAAARRFARNYLDLCLREELLLDGPNVLGKDNYPGFVAHRHDQSILSLLSKKHRLPTYRDPSQFGNDSLRRYPNSPYPQILEHTRRADRSWWQKAKGSLRSILDRTSAGKPLS